MTEFRFGILLAALCVLQSVHCNLWAWECRDQGETAHCLKVEATESNKASSSRCRLTCGSHGDLFPKPKEVELGKDVFYFHPDNINPTIDGRSPPVFGLIRSALNLMTERLATNTPSKRPPSGSLSNRFKDNILSLSIIVPGSDDQLTMTTDESYKLDISSSGRSPYILNVNITAPTFFGARHALETLSQLISYDENVDLYEIVSYARIVDQPAYPYRGIIVDTSRNFLPVPLILKTIDALSFHKLNTFHWHITDSQSFPMFLRNLPNMTYYGAYGPDKIYSREDILGVVEYAQVRGVRVLPEFDAPAHVGYGWEWGPSAGLGNLVVCLGKQPWTSYCSGPPCGQFNLANPNIYSVLSQLYKDMVELFKPIDLFHYGGDEVNVNCWNSSEEIVQWMVNNGNSLDEDSYYEQWNIFQEEARQLLTEANNGVEVPGILWTSSLTEEGRADKYLDKDKYIIQIWSTKDDPVIPDVLQKGYDVIFSNHDAFYLDCGVGSWVAGGNNWCPYSGWQNVYDNNFRKTVQNLTGSDDYQNQILGGEGALWTEQVDEHNFEVRLWPRASALAERLWSDPDTSHTLAWSRMIGNRERIVKRGVNADRLQPEWCRQNSGECLLPYSPPPVEASLAIRRTERPCWILLIVLSVVFY